MSHPAANLSLAPPVADHETAAEQYPRVLVMWCTLAFCMSAWGIVIFSVRHFV